MWNRFSRSFMERVFAAVLLFSLVAVLAMPFKFPWHYEGHSPCHARRAHAVQVHVTPPPPIPHINPTPPLPPTPPVPVIPPVPAG